MHRRGAVSGARRGARRMAAHTRRMPSRITFHGCYTAIVTPFSADGSSVDLARLEEGIKRQAAGKVTGIVPCGTTGESPTLTEEEHARVVETAVRVGRAAGLQVVAGAGSNSTAHAVHLQKLARQLGADAGLQVTPYYNKPSDRKSTRLNSSHSSVSRMPSSA